jgi:hypothetical protein
MKTNTIIDPAQSGGKIPTLTVHGLRLLLEKLEAEGKGELAVAVDYDCTYDLGILEENFQEIGGKLYIGRT